MISGISDDYGGKYDDDKNDGLVRIVVMKMMTIMMRVKVMIPVIIGTSKNNRFNDQNNSSARASRFLVHFFDVHCTTTT